MFDILRGHKLSRRQFLSAGLALAGSAIAMSPRRALAESAGDRNEIVRLALLSDTHTPHNPGNHFRGFHPHKNLREAVGRIDARLTAGSGEFTVRAIGGNRQLDGYFRRLDWRT